MVDARARGETMVLQRLFGDDERRRCAVADLRAGRGGDRAAFLKDLDPRNAFERRVESDALVDKVSLAAVRRVELYPDDLALAMAGLGRRLSASVALGRIGVELVLRATVFLEDRTSTR